MRNKFGSKKIRLDGKRSQLAPVISNFLFHSSQDPKEEQKEYVTLKINIREFLHKKQSRKILSQILFDLQKDVAGATRDRLYTLYTELELHHDALAKLKSWRWFTVAQGISELAQMKVPDAHMLLRKFVNDRRGIVRKQAELAIVGLLPNGIEYLLDTTRYSISEWQQLKLIETLESIPNYLPPQFSTWLISSNKDVVLFALRLIKHYNQKGAEAAITRLIQHKDDQIKIAAIRCIVDFNYPQSLVLLTRLFGISRDPVKVAILDAFKELGSPDNIAFLEEVAATEKSFSVHGKALTAINTILPETVLPTADLLDIESIGSSKRLYPETTTTRSEEVNAASEDIVGVVPAIPVSDLEPNEPEEVVITSDSIVVETVIPVEPEFEISFPEEENDAPVVANTRVTASPLDELSKSDLEEAYNTMSEDEKEQLIQTFEGNTEALGEKEYLLIEAMAEQEVNSELGYRAFRILQSQHSEKSLLTPSYELLTDQEKADLTTPLPLSCHSIFHELYHYASDLDSRLILLKEIAALGDTKELPFLETLVEDKELRIQDAVEHAKLAILERLDTGTTTQPSPIKEAVASEDTIGEEQEDHRLPLELAFLYDEVGILPAVPQKEARIFDFDLSDAFELREQNGID